MKVVEGRESRVENRKRILVIRNRQRTRVLNMSLLRRMARHLLEQEFGLSAYELGFHFVGASEMARVNEQFLQHSGSTDVITFDHGSSADRLHGEIFVSIPDAVQQAREFKGTWQSEAVRYVVHGLLHLRGFDDLQASTRRLMKRQEDRLVDSIASKFALNQLARTRNSKLKTRKPS